MASTEEKIIMNWLIQFGGSPLTHIGRALRLRRPIWLAY